MDLTRRMHVTIHGAVQGVGFRPFIYRLASELQLTGWVENSPGGVNIEVEGPLPTLTRFLLRIEPERPPRSFIQNLEHLILDPVGFGDFEIRPSRESGSKTALVLPDAAPCPECLYEIFDPADRRFLYPFTNCTNCGPRFSILRSLPYDRPNTTMAAFTMCPECRREYEDPRNRRFHAQPNACPACGPVVSLWGSDGAAMENGHEALLRAVREVRAGRILALKGQGGFQLIVDARSEAAVTELRRRKHREEKPFAVMVSDLSVAHDACEISELERRLLHSPESPIVLLRRRTGASHSASVTECVAPANPFLGVMLPSTPLHHIFLHELGIPVVATSGNISDEPICTDEQEALVRLRGIADVFLVHNRPIHRHVDDSVVRVMLGRELVIRRARGYAPLPITHADDLPELLAVGPHLKNTVAVSRGRNVFLSQHIGDLETEESLKAFHRETSSLQTLFAITPRQVVSDLHPEYLSTKAAAKAGLPVLHIQHHWAHVASCMAENGLDGEVLGVSWDGTGYGSDGTVWGGEFLVPANGEFRRVAHLRTFRLPGGDSAIREPRRAAAGILYELGGEDSLASGSPETSRAFTPAEIAVIRQMLGRGVNSPVTSSAGRLFDAVASFLRLRQQCSFEGQAAMELEFSAGRSTDTLEYPWEIVKTGTNGTMVLDWGPMVQGILADIHRGAGVESIARRFHNTLVSMIVGVARELLIQRVVLTGGCFQNRILTEGVVGALEQARFRPYWHQRVPPNDGGIALGQIHAAALRLTYAKEKDHVSGNPR